MTALATTLPLADEQIEQIAQHVRDDGAARARFNAERPVNPDAEPISMQMLMSLAIASVERHIGLGMFATLSDRQRAFFSWQYVAGFATAAAEVNRA